MIIDGTTPRSSKPPPTRPNRCTRLYNPAIRHRIELAEAEPPVSICEWNRPVVGWHQREDVTPGGSLKAPGSKEDLYEAGNLFVVYRNHFGGRANGRGRICSNHLFWHQQS